MLDKSVAVDVTGLFSRALSPKPGISVSVYIGRNKELLYPKKRHFDLVLRGLGGKELPGGSRIVEPLP